MKAKVRIACSKMMMKESTRAEMMVPTVIHFVKRNSRPVKSSGTFFLVDMYSTRNALRSGYLKGRISFVQIAEATL